MKLWLMVRPVVSHFNDRGFKMNVEQDIEYIEARSGLKRSKAANTELAIDVTTGAVVLTWAGVWGHHVGNSLKKVRTEKELLLQEKELADIGLKEANQKITLMQDMQKGADWVQSDNEKIEYFSKLKTGQKEKIDHLRENGVAYPTGIAVAHGAGLIVVASVTYMLLKKAGKISRLAEIIANFSKDNTKSKPSHRLENKV